jgi:copper homeostasis protein
VIFEGCVATVDSALAMQRAGAQRLELCQRLEVGGLTPSYEMLQDVLAAVSIPVFAIVRVRGGEDFRSTPREVATLAVQARRLRELGAGGLVFGFLDANGDVDVAATRALIDASRPLPVTFHRAFDRTRDLTASLEVLIGLGIERVLTSGGEPNAFRGRHRLREFVTQARGRIIIVAGGGVRESNWQAIVADGGVTELHGSQPIRLAGAKGPPR